MRRTLRPALIVLPLLLIVSLTSQLTFACGPFTLDAVFTFVVHPELPLEKFARGEIGVVQPTYARSYLFTAYRNLNGQPLSEREQNGVLQLWKERLESSSPDSDESGPKLWWDARAMVNGAGTALHIETYRHRDKPNEYESYLNCQKDAFETAAKTLELRVKKFGAANAMMRDWVTAQDLVFANCAEGTQIPAAAPEEADALIKADRAYQIAAANFYATNFDEANKRFEAIERDNSSPWRQIAAYLSARTSLRKASLGPAESRTDSLSRAEATLKKVLNDRGLSSVHPAAAKLMTLVQLRLHPEMRARELAQALQKNDDENMKQDLWDYTVLLDDFIQTDEVAELQIKQFPASLRKDDLTDWIVTFESGGEEPLAHSLERWRATSAMPWLVAALSKITSAHPQAAMLASAADKVSPSSPAFASVAFHQVRLAIESGKTDQARMKLDDLLAKHRSRLPASSVNLFLGLRMQLANNLTEFLKYAQRLPAGFTWNEDEREIAANLDDADLGKNAAGTPSFDVDGARILNEKLPLSLLQQAAESKTLPDRLRLEVAQATWLRAVLLDDQKRARELAPTLRTLAPALVPLLDNYLAAQPADASKFAGIYMWLKAPGLQPIVTSGVGHRSEVDKQDEYRDNWWCSAASTGSAGDGETKTDSKLMWAPAVTANADPRSLLFLTAAQKTSAGNEYSRLSTFGAAPNYLCREVIAWVEKHPTDRRGPEALHLAVKTTRYGCTDKETRKWSKAAYDLLHKNFPANPWTRKTPYWFKD